MARKKSRIYTRRRGGEARYYGDFRDVGGGREALIAEGDTRATTDPVIAEALVARRLEQLQEAKRDTVLLGVRRRATLQGYAAEHLVKKKKSGTVTDDWLEAVEGHLARAVEFLGADRDVASIGVEHVEAWLRWLREQENGRGGKLSPTTQRKHLFSLSNLFRRAQQDGIIRGVNPVAALMEKPLNHQAEASWLEVWEAALLLEAARTMDLQRAAGSTAGARVSAAIGSVLGEGLVADEEFCRRMRDAGKFTSVERLQLYREGSRIPTKEYVLTAARVLGLPELSLWRPRGRDREPLPSYTYPLIATVLLTGGRRREIFGLEIGDVSFNRGTVTVRPNRWRRIKTKTSLRSVPLWPQLRECLEPYVAARLAEGATATDLLFPSATGKLLDDRAYDILDAVAEAAGWRAGEIRFKAMRHTYCAARLQTLDRGHPVSEYTVGRELGHGGFDLVRRVYGHLGTIRHRSENVEYRIEQQREEIPRERLKTIMKAI